MNRADLMSVDQEQVMDAVLRDDGTGICAACGSEQGCTEPDAERITCEDCGQPSVYGAEQLLLMVVA